MHREPITSSVFDMNDTFLDECGIEVVIEEVSGSLETPTTGDSTIGDGTGITGVDPAIVLRAIANPSGFAGDASGGPEANAPDYGFLVEAALQPVDGATDQEQEIAEAEEENADAEANLGPSTGADGMVALSMGRPGGTLENPAGARIIVPRDALSDQTTVMLQPVSDHDLPEIAGISLVPGTAFDVSFSAADGMAAAALQAPAHLTIALDSASSDTGARIYRIDGAAAEPMPVIDADQGSVTTEVNEHSRFVVGVPASGRCGFDEVVQSHHRWRIGTRRSSFSGLVDLSGFFPTQDSHHSGAAAAAQSRALSLDCGCICTVLLCRVDRNLPIQKRHWQECCRCIR